MLYEVITVDLCREAGAAERMDREGEIHEGFCISVDHELFRVDLKKYSGGQTVVCYRNNFV